MIDVERVDFIRVPVTDMEEATHFYGEVLGLERNPNSPAEDWVEYEVGSVTLAVMTPHTHDYEFAPLPLSTIALRVPDVAAARARLEAAGFEVGEVWDSGVCQGAGVSDPAGNASSCTTATRRTRKARRPESARPWRASGDVGCLVGSLAGKALVHEAGNTRERTTGSRYLPGTMTRRRGRRSAFSTSRATICGPGV
jgi:catechol 2,3-dioxygenase-like lactoylglutathione lyase family enzyme